MDDAKIKALQDLDDGPYVVDLNAGPVADGEDWRFGRVTFFRRKSPDGLLPTVFDPGDGGSKAVRLAVRTGAYTGPLADPGDAVNDRCELRGPQEALGTDTWNRFSIRVPADVPATPRRLVVAQMKMPYDASGDGSPAIALRIDQGRWLVSVEHLYEPSDLKVGRYLSDPADGRCATGVPAYDHSNFDKHTGPTDFQVRALVASDHDGVQTELRQREYSRCTTGVHVERLADLPVLDAGGSWTDFAFRMRSSGQKDVDGLAEIYVGGTLVARARGEFGYPNTVAKPMQYFKVGPYRNNDSEWGNEPLGLEYRDIRRGRTAAEVGLDPALA